MIQRNQPALRDKTHNDPKEKEMLLVKEEKVQKDGNVIGKRRREDTERW